jgi:hypothetical protein
MAQSSLTDICFFPYILYDVRRFYRIYREVAYVTRSATKGPASQVLALAHFSMKLPVICLYTCSCA